MKVYVISSYPTEGCGVSKYTENLIDALMTNSIDVVHRRLFFYREKYSSLYLFKFFSEIRKMKPDIVHIQYTPTICGPFFPFFLSFFIIFKFKVKIIITAHEKPSVYLKNQNRVGKFLFKFYECLAYNRSNLIFVHTNQHKLELIKEYGLDELKIKVISYGIGAPADVKNLDCNSIKERYDLNNKKIITFFGSIRPTKGIEYLIEAYYEFSKSRCDYILLIAGSAPEIWDGYLKKIQSMVNDLGIIDKVCFTGFIPDYEVPLIFNISEFVVLPYTQVTQSEVLHQAISYMKPVIVTDVGGIGEIVNNYNIGIVVPPNNSKMITYALDTLIDFDTNIYERNIEKLRDEKSWDRVAKNHVSEYKR